MTDAKITAANQTQHRRAMAARNQNSRSQIASRCKRRRSELSAGGDSGDSKRLARPSNRDARRENAERDVLRDVMPRIRKRVPARRHTHTFVTRR